MKYQAGKSSKLHNFLEKPRRRLRLTTNRIVRLTRAIGVITALAIAAGKLIEQLIHLAHVLGWG